MPGCSREHQPLGVKRGHPESQKGRWKSWGEFHGWHGKAVSGSKTCTAEVSTEECPVSLGAGIVVISSPVIFRRVVRKAAGCSRWSERWIGSQKKALDSWKRSGVFGVFFFRWKRVERLRLLLCFLCRALCWSLPAGGPCVSTHPSSSPVGLELLGKVGARLTLCDPVPGVVSGMRWGSEYAGDRVPLGLLGDRLCLLHFIDSKVKYKEGCMCFGQGHK